MGKKEYWLERREASRPANGKTIRKEGISKEKNEEWNRETEIKSWKIKKKE